MYLPYFIFVLYAVSTSYCTRDIPSIETSFYTEVIEKRPNMYGLICTDDDEMTGWCKKLFYRPHYRYQLKIHLNNRAYISNRNLCEQHPITFRTNYETFPKNHFENMFPCFGRRTTIRTHSSVDDYFHKFYLSYLPTKKSYYVFRAERHGELEIRYTFYEEILQDSWQRLGATVTDTLEGNEYLGEEILHTVEMYVYWPEEIENIFVNEMIGNETPKPNQLAAVDAPTLLVICVSILGFSHIPDANFWMDHNKMLIRKPPPQKIKLYFDMETQFTGSPHEGYPCHGKDVRDIPSQNQKYSNMFLISSGPQKDTIFIFSSLGNENHYMIRSFIANINFDNFSLQKSIFDAYIPTQAGPSEPPRSAQPSLPPRHFALGYLPRPPAPQTQTRLMPLAPPSQPYPPPKPFTIYDPSMHPSQQIPFATQPPAFVPSTFSMPPGTSNPRRFPAYQATPSQPIPFSTQPPAFVPSTFSMPPGTSDPRRFPAYQATPSQQLAIPPPSTALPSTSSMPAETSAHTFPAYQATAGTSGSTLLPSSSRTSDSQTSDHFKPSDT